MAPARRLVNRSATASSRPSARPREKVSLPEYEPVACKLNPSVKIAISELSSSRTSSQNLIRDSLREASRNLGNSVGDIQERLLLSLKRLENLQRRRQEKGTDKSTEEERLENHVAKLREQVARLTEKSEAAMRNVVDAKVRLEDQQAAMRELYESVAKIVRAHRGEEDSADNIRGPWAEYSDLHRKKAEDYAALTAHQRYALDNEYATFKKMWHDGMVGDEGPPLPDRSRWFDSQGQPVIAGVHQAEDNDGSDDDMRVERETISFICPITQQVMQEPYSNRLCRHTFEKDAIKHHLSVNDPIQCPQSGCDKVSHLILPVARM